MKYPEVNPLNNEIDVGFNKECFGHWAIAHREATFGGLSIKRHCIEFREPNAECLTAKAILIF